MAFADMRMKMREKPGGQEIISYSYKKPLRGLLLARAIDSPIHNSTFI